MSKVIAIAGESGSGKTTAMRNLNSTETYYIDCDRKGLPWKGWREQYNRENKNYIAIYQPQKIIKIIENINNEAPHIKYIVIDTINGIMVGDEYDRRNEKTYDKWADLAWSVWELMDKAYSYRDDLTLIFIAHTQTERDESGYQFTRIKTSGKKLDKIALESKLTTVLIAKSVSGKYLFETKSNNSTCKTPMGAFDVDTIDNDITIVIKALEEY